MPHRDPWNNVANVSEGSAATVKKERHEDRYLHRFLQASAHCGTEASVAEAG